MQKKKNTQEFGPNIEISPSKLDQIDYMKLDSEHNIADMIDKGGVY